MPHCQEAPCSRLPPHCECREPWPPPPWATIRNDHRPDGTASCAGWAGRPPPAPSQTGPSPNPPYTRKRQASRRHRAPRACGRAAGRRVRTACHPRRPPPHKRCPTPSGVRRRSRENAARPLAHWAAQGATAADARRDRAPPASESAAEMPPLPRRAARRDGRWHSSETPRGRAPRNRAVSRRRAHRNRTRQPNARARPWLQAAPETSGSIWSA